jgi:hypothetical protein
MLQIGMDFFRQRKCVPTSLGGYYATVLNIDAFDDLRLGLMVRVLGSPCFSNDQVIFATVVSSCCFSFLLFKDDACPRVH